MVLCVDSCAGNGGRFFRVAKYFLLVSRGIPNALLLGDSGSNCFLLENESDEYEKIIETVKVEKKILLILGSFKKAIHRDCRYQTECITFTIDKVACPRKRSESPARLPSPCEQRNFLINSFLRQLANRPKELRKKDAEGSIGQQSSGRGGDFPRVS